MSLTGNPLARLLEEVPRHYDANAERVMLEADVLAALSAAPVGVRVKPLEWIARDDLKGLHEARGADGLYRNIWDQQNGTWVYEGDPTANPQHQSRLPTLEAAKAAAQSDYEARIMAALTPAPHVNETPGSEHDEGDVLSPAPADEVRGAALMEQAVAALRTLLIAADAGSYADYFNAIEEGHAILALIEKDTK